MPPWKKPPPPRPPSNDAPPPDAPVAAAGSTSTYYSCPPPVPRVVAARDGDGNDVYVEIPAAVSTVVVGYEFRLQLTDRAGEDREDRGRDDEATLARLLPEVQRRLGEGLGRHMREGDEEDGDGESCDGYPVDDFRRRLLRLDRRRPVVARRAGVEDETRIIDVSASSPLEIDADKQCISRDDGCYIARGALEATYVGYNEAGVRSVLLRAVRDDMAHGHDANDRCRGRGRDCDDGDAYTLAFLGEDSAGDAGLSGDPTQSLAISGVVSSRSAAAADDGAREITGVGAAIMGLMIGMLCLTLAALMRRRKKRGAIGKDGRGGDDERWASDANSESEDN